MRTADAAAADGGRPTGILYSFQGRHVERHNSNCRSSHARRLVSGENNDPIAHHCGHGSQWFWIGDRLAVDGPVANQNHVLR